MTPQSDASVPRRSPAVRIVLLYGLVSVAWILSSDRLLDAIHADPSSPWKYHKRWLFVAMTGLFLFVLIRRAWRVQTALFSDLAESKRRIEGLIASLPGFVYRRRFDDRWTMEFLSSGCRELTGAPPEAFAGSSAYGARIRPEDRDKAWERIRRSIERGRSFSVSYRFRDAAGRERWASEHGRGVPGERGDIVAIEGFVTDVTDRRRLEEQFLQAQKMEAVGRLAGGVAHDFNNLLTAILGYSQLLRRRIAPGDALRHDVDEIHAAGERASALTRQLLSFSRKREARPRPVDVGRVLSDFRKLLDRVLGEDVEIRIDLPDAPAIAWIDPGQVEQVVMNLAVNARDAMAGGGLLRLAVEPIDVDEDFTASRLPLESGPYVRLTVADTGCGMDETTLSRLFEPFFTTKPPGEGTGLGLSTVFEIVRASQGGIDVRSEAGRGTAFHVYLPRLADRCAPHEAPPASVQVVAPTGADSTVVIAEDDAQVRHLVGAVFSTAGYRVVETGTGEGALAALSAANGAVRLVVSDIVLPDMTGHELIRRWTSDRPEPTVPVLLVSGYPQTEESGGRVFLAKPFTPSQLAEKANTILTSTS